jgi:hypothetical protein
MPVYSNVRCGACVHRERMHAHRTRSASSRASTRVQRDACRKKAMRRCDNACEFLARSHAIDAIDACVSTC